MRIRDEQRDDIRMVILRTIYNETYAMEPDFFNADYIAKREIRAIIRYNDDTVLRAKVDTVTAKIVDILKG